MGEEPVTPQSGLIVEIPEAEPLVQSFRLELDQNARSGVPAHVTVLYPFGPPDAIDDAILDRLRSVFAAVPGFAFVLDHTDWFGEQVLWVGPADDQPFRTLTRVAVAAFPDHLPYGGAFGMDPIPHLTVGEDGEPAVMRDAEATIRPGLPVSGTASSVSLLVQDETGHWSRRERFPLAATDQQHDRLSEPA